ncbi:MAG: CARDB domain-containing protein [Methanoregula sp.]|nr:CARDB domain-containing protein [Methanoregula sp.]
MKYPKVILIFFVLSLIGILPVMGVDTYQPGTSPQISASISGVNEFTAGQDITINVLVRNSGLSTAKFITIGTIDRDDLPTTAKMVKVGLGSGNAPVIIKSDPQNIGDIQSQGLVSVPIFAKILSNATMGEYQIPLTIQYTYLESADNYVADYLQNHYRVVSETYPLVITIKPQVKIDVLDAVPENLNVGNGGYLNITIQNIGFEDGKKATVKIVRNGQSPIIPTDSSVFVGDFPRNGIVTCRYKVSVSDNAAQQTYPVDVVVTYENRDGDIVTSATDTVGIPIGGKLTFSVTSEPVHISPGSDSTITVEYRNNGDTTAYNSQARISAVDPFTSSDDTAYIGDLKPGETATARYQIHADDAAESRTYLLDAEIRFRDSLGNSQVSDTFKVPVLVEPEQESSGLVSILPALALIVIIGIGAGYYLLVMRKKK